MRVSPWLRYHCEVYATLSEALEAVKQSEGEQTVYLCGGINGLEDGACKDWRSVARETLIPGPGRSRFRVLDPMERDYRGKEEGNDKAIVEGDLADVFASTILLINATRPSWGTGMETDRAWTYRKRLVAFMEER